MSIQQTKKQSDLEKRLRLLRQQVYGRGSDNSRVKVTSDTSIHRPTDILTHRYTGTQISSGTPITSDLTYLRHDLIKIGTLATAAFGVQAILFYLLQNHILKLNIF